MTELYQPIAELLAAVRSRRQRIVVFGALARGALFSAVGLGALLLLVAPSGRTPALVAALAAAGVAVVAGAFVWALRGVWARPSDAVTARFIEERHPGLDERLVSATGVASADPDSRPLFAPAMIRDAARAVAMIEPAAIVPAEAIRRAGIQAVAAGVALVAVAFIGRHQVRQSFDALALSLFPSRIAIEVTPGDVKVPAGANLGIAARLIGNDAPVIAQLQWTNGEGEEWRTQEMNASRELGFATTLSGLANSFRYRVVAGGAESRMFTVTVVHAPRVERIDLEYTYPKALGMAARTEQDGGDIYAPAGTNVRVVVHTDRPAADGRLAFGKNEPLTLTADASGRQLAGTFTIAEDNSYRVGLSDRDGMASQGDTEYFVRVLDDRPPDVRVVQPASDRRVTALEEVDIVAEADDDFGVAAMELVYAVRGGGEKVVPIRIEPRATSVSGSHTLYMEDFDVRPGDFVSYYVRARDLERGKRSSESRSDIFFLEIKPFEEEFSLAQSQAAMGGGASNPQIDDLVNAQKEIIVATWKLDRRAKAAAGARSAQDVRAVGAAESELKTKVEQTASAFGTSRLRSPRRPATGRGGAPLPQPPTPPARAGQTLAEEDAMTAAANAMGHAVTALNAVKTSEAVAPEMEALNHLLRAQADVKKREVQRQQAGGGGGGNRSSQDLSSLFDKELARHQETNYETPSTSSSGQKDPQKDSALDKIKELASRQDELTKRQQELARNQAQLSEEQRKRELEKLTRDQAQLQQSVEALAQQMAAASQQTQGAAGKPDEAGQQSSPGQAQRGQQPGQQQSGQQPGGQQQAGQSGKPGQSGQRQAANSGQDTGNGGDRGTRELRRIAEEMRNATGELRRQNASEASDRSKRALDDLRALEQQMQGSSPDGRRRALGDLQLEARQLADAERRIATDAARAGQGGDDADAMRRLAGEQERLSERLGKVQEGLKQQAQSGAGQGKDAASGQEMQRAAGEASREIDRQRLRERMNQSAEAMRGSAGSPGGQDRGSQASREDIAKALDRLADRLSAAGNARGGDGESQKLTGNMARVQELRERLDSISERLDQLNREASGQSPGQSNQPSSAQRGQNAASGQPATASQNGRSGQPGQNGTPQSSPGERGQPGQGQSGSGAGTEMARLQQEASRAAEEVRQLLGQARREDNAVGQGGAGRTFEGQGMVLSAPGTEGFKQDFAKWQELNRQMTAALDQVESSIARRLGEKEARDRLAAGAEEAPPAHYQQQVDSYFRALAARKKP